MKSSIELSVVVPVFNCEKIICNFLEKIEEILKSKNLEYEIIVVNDGSKDSTIKKIEKLKNERIRLINHPTNLGKGFSVKDGVFAAKGERIIFIDGDLDINVENLTNCINALENCDICIGSKTHPNSEVISPPFRRFLSLIFNFLVRFFLCLEFRDTQTGLKGGKKSVLKKIFKNMLVKRYAFDVEMLLISKLLKLKVVEVPVKVILKPKFKFREIIRMLLDLLSINYRLRIKRWYLKVIKK